MASNSGSMDAQPASSKSCPRYGWVSVLQEMCRRLRQYHRHTNCPQTLRYPAMAAGPPPSGWQTLTQPVDAVLIFGVLLGQLSSLRHFNTACKIRATATPNNLSLRTSRGGSSPCRHPAKSYFCSHRQSSVRDTDGLAGACCQVVVGVGEVVGAGGGVRRHRKLIAGCSCRS